MSLVVKRFPPAREAQFRAVRMEALAEINASTYWLVALLVMVFVFWDWFVDPVNWKTAGVIRGVGSLVILATGVVQRVSGRVAWAPAIARTRFATAVLSVAGALAVLDQGYVVGLAGLVAVFLSGPYIALDRRDLLVLNALPLAGIGIIMYVADLERFAVINACIFLALSVAVGMLLARVFEASNRRAFALGQQLTLEARTDALSGLLNRRALEEIAAVELQRGEQAALSVILADVDHFKQINDRHGHSAGDRVIRAIAEHLGTTMRASDALGRWGGEEFLAILPGTSAEEARQVAERMRAAVEAVAMPIDPDLHVTLSLGVAERAAGSTSDPQPWNQLVKAADDAMYQAKSAGRNQVVVAR